jgi:hypothetical protein
MKRSWLIAAVFLAACLLAGWAAVQKLMSVAVQTTQLRSAAVYGNNILTTLKFADKVTVPAQPSGAPKGWLYVIAPDGKQKGWVNLAALIEKDIKLAPAGSVKQGASSGDVSLAGKGFLEAEADFVSTQGLNEGAVDDMERIQVPYASVEDFMRWGGLSAPGGDK